MAEYTGSDRRLAYLFTNGKVVSGYYYNGQMYKDSAHTELITGSVDCLYIDKSTTTLYLYDGSAYEEVQGGGGGSIVTITPTLSTGTKIADYSIDGTIDSLYAPNGGSSSLDGLTDVTITTPSDGQALLYDSTTGEWVNGTISGGASALSELTDVELDSLQDGQIIKYDSTEQKWINSELQLLAPLIYSTDEREVGCWVDGRPLYQKTEKITLDSPLEPQNSRQLNLSSFPSNTKLISVDSVLGYYNGSSAILSNIKRFSEENNYNTGFDGLAVYYEATMNSIYVRTGTNYGNYPSAGVDNRMKEFYVTYRYVKNSDTAGSGHWASAGEAHHYSTSEQIVGTWIDGKPIYEKTLVFLDNRIVSGDNFLATGISDMELVIDVRAFITNSAHISIRPINTYEFNATQDSLFYEINMSTGEIRIRGNGTWPTPNIYFTIQYTKTTD